jgi:hypothetical protein
VVLNTLFGMETLPNVIPLEMIIAAINHSKFVEEAKIIAFVMIVSNTKQERKINATFQKKVGF